MGNQFVFNVKAIDESIRSHANHSLLWFKWSSRRMCESCRQPDS